MDNFDELASDPAIRLAELQSNLNALHSDPAVPRPAPARAVAARKPDDRRSLIESGRR